MPRRRFQQTASPSSSSESENRFQTPEKPPDQTDYNLEYTQNAQNVNRIEDGPSTSRRATIRRSVRHVPEQPPSARHEPEQLPAPRTRPPRKNVPPVSTKERNERRFQTEVIMLCKRTAPLVPKLPFGRLVREIMHSVSSTVDRITFEALMALQEATEMYITQQLQDAYLLTLHRGRVTLMSKDLQLLRLLRWNNPANC